MRATPSCALLLTLIVAGCGGGGGGNSNPPQPINRDPTAILFADRISGEEPLTVNFRLECSDPDGINDLESSRFDAGNGEIFTGLPPSNRTIIYEEEETYTASLTCIDKSGAEGSSSVDIVVDPKLPENQTYVFSTGETAQIESIEGGTITFSQSVDSSLSPGDIIVSGISDVTPYGFLREINSISGDRTTLLTSQAAIEEAVEDGYFSFGENLSPLVSQTSFNINVQALPKSASESLNSFDGSSNTQENSNFDFNINLEDIILFDQDGNYSTTHDQIRANVDLSFNLSYEFDFEINDGQMTNINFNHTINETSNLEIISEAQLNLTDEEIKIGEYNFSPFVAGVIPGTFIPIIIAPQVGIYAGLDGEIPRIQTSVEQEATLSVGLEYANGSWSSSRDFSNEFGFTLPDSFAISDFKASVGPKLNLLLYGVVGPSGEINSYLEFESDEFFWSLYGGLEAKLGIDTGVFSSVISDYSETFPLGRRLLTREEKEIIPLVDSRDGQIYDTIKIGNQTWMAENLNYAAGGSRCYDNNSSNCDTYGRLYDGELAQSVCPNEWHLPSKTEWDTLINHLGGTSVAGGKMKSTALWNPPNTEATNESGFTALPAGYHAPSTSPYFFNKGNNTIFWSSSRLPFPEFQGSKYGYKLEHDVASIGDNTHYAHAFGLSVRCLED